MNEQGRIHVVEKKLEKSFDNIKNDMHAVNYWIHDLYRNNNNVPDKFDQIVGKMIDAMERQLDAMESLFNDVAISSKRQMRRLDIVEAINRELLTKLDYLAGKLEVKKTPVKIQTRKKKVSFYSSGIKGAKFHTKDCLSFRRLKKPKSYDSIQDARKAGLTFCKLCVPTEKS